MSRSPLLRNIKGELVPSCSFCGVCLLLYLSFIHLVLYAQFSEGKETKDEGKLEPFIFDGAKMYPLTHKQVNLVRLTKKIYSRALLDVCQEVSPVSFFLPPFSP